MLNKKKVSGNGPPSDPPKFNLNDSKIFLKFPQKISTITLKYQKSN